MAVIEPQPTNDQDGESVVAPPHAKPRTTRVVGVVLALALLVGASWWAMASGVLGPGSRGGHADRNDEFDRVAQSALWNAYLVEMAIYSRDQAFTGDPQTLRAIDPELNFGGFGGPSDIRVETGDARSTVCLGVQSESGWRYFIRQVQVGNQAAHGADTGLSYASGTATDDFAIRCGASNGGEPWIDMPANAGWARDPYDPAFVANCRQTGASAQSDGPPCNPEQQAQATLLNASAAELECHDIGDKPQPAHTGAGDPSQPGTCTRGGFESPVTIRLVETSDGRVTCAGVQSESGTRYYMKYAGIGQTNRPRARYVAKSDASHDMTASCSSAAIAGWSIFPSVAGW